MSARLDERTFKSSKGPPKWHSNKVLWYIVTQIKMALSFIRLIEKFELYAFAQLRLNLQIIDGF